MESIQFIDQGWQTYGYLGALAAILSTSVGTLKHPVIQKVLPKRMQWRGLKPAVKLAVIFVAACAGSGLMAYLGGVSVVAAIGLGISAGFAAIGMRETKQALVVKGTLNELPDVGSRRLSIKTKLELPK